MKMVIIEPLGVEEGKLLAMAREALGDRVEIVYYNGHRRAHRARKGC